MTEDRWPELCKLVEEDDGLPTRKAGHWTEDKLFFWNRYIDRNSGNIRRMFADIYKSQLERHLGYRVFGEEIITCKRGALYRLVYASKHERGLDFWNKISNKDPSGQKRLFH